MTPKQRAVIQSVLDAWDISQEEKYDELCYDKFVSAGGIEPLRELLVEDAGISPAKRPHC